MKKSARNSTISVEPYIPDLPDESYIPKLSDESYISKLPDELYVPEIPVETYTSQHANESYVPELPEVASFGLVPWGVSSNESFVFEEPEAENNYGGGFTLVKVQVIPGRPSSEDLTTFMTLWLFVIVLCASFILNTLLLLVFRRGKQFFSKARFYFVVRQVLICNIVYAIASALTTVPTTLFLDEEQTTNYTRTNFYEVATMFGICSQEMIIYTNVLMAIHRVMVMMCSTSTVRIIEGFPLLLITLLLWCLSISFAILFVHAKCGYRFMLTTEDSGKFEFGCDNIDENIQEALGTFLFCRAITVPLLLILFYCIILYKIISSKSGMEINSTNAVELSVLKQAMFIFFIFEISFFFAYFVISTETSLENGFLAKTMANVLDMLVGALSPLCLFAVSRKVRTQIHQIMLEPCCCNENQVVKLPKPLNKPSVSSGHKSTEEYRNRKTVC